MRNLKRTLSLALASIMVLGMMVVGAGAASYDKFSDKNDIVNKDAVAMVTELGIIAGLPDGSYGPTQNIDRASFARLICVALNGGKEPTLGNLTTNFKDTKGNWAEKYIAYCVQKGIIAGKGNNTFAPAAQVTGSEAAKMLLVAVGYNTTYENIGGATWQLSTDVLANSVGLYKGLESINTSASLTRDSAAQMIYNALNADMVKYEIVPGVNANGQITANTQRSKTGNTLLEDAFKALKVEGVVKANEFAALDGAAVQDEGKTYIALTDTYANLNTGSFKVTTDLSMIGKAVTLFVRPDSNSKDASKATVLGNALVSDTNKVAVLTSGKSTTTKLNDYLDDNNLKTDSKTEWYINFAIQTNGSGSTLANKPLTSNEAGKTLTFIDKNGDGVVDYALQLVKTFGKVTSYNTSGKGTINVAAKNAAADITYKSLSSTKAATEVNGFEDVKKDDYVFFYQIGKEYFVEKAKSVEATVSSIKGEKIVADGTTYEQSGLVAFVNDDGDKKLYNGAVDLGDKATFYLDDAGYVVFTDAEGTANEYLMVVNVDDYSDVNEYARTKILKTDGTTEVVNAYVDGASKAAATKAGVYAYTVNSKGVYKLTQKDLTVESVDGAKIEKGNTTIVSNKVLANSQTIFVVERGNDNYTIYTGIANVPKEITVTTGKAIVGSDKYAKAVFLTNSSMTGATEGIYVLDENPTVSGTSDDKTYTYDVIYKGEKTTLTGDKGLFATTGYYNDVSINGTEITKVTGSVIAPSEALKASKGVITNGAGTFSTNDKTVVLYVDDTDVSISSLGAITVKDGTIKGDNIIIMPDSDNDNIAAYVPICK